MRRFDARIVFGTLLILMGGLLFLEKIGPLHGAADFFWGLMFLAGAGYFFYVFYRNPQTQWWSIIPGMVLLGISAEIFLPSSLDYWGGAVFLGAISLAFWLVYITDRSRWWGIIPGGVLLTLAAITLIREDTNGFGTGGFFFLGLGLTFLLVALLPNPLGKTQWAYIPALVLLIMGALLGSASTAGFAAYVWPVVLIASGVGIIVYYFFKRE